MASNPRIRASDRDRDRTAELLREHHAVGRLDPEEFAERLDKSFQAKTIEELDQLTADLPAIDLYPLPTSSLPRARRVNSGLPASYVRGGASSSGFRVRWRGVSGWPAAWGGYAAFLLVCLVLWAIGAPVPVIAAGVIGLGMITGQVIGRRVVGHGRLSPSLTSGQHSQHGQRDQLDQHGRRGQPDQLEGADDRD
ncbi:MAG TPA: DUF1707 domain-containing protein [Streptosporangiaceae bacterium]|nr:DUF1707 domain-containing protein [Streptosporangiaceae bacterium]